MKNNITLRKFTYVVILGLFFSFSGYGTHIRAGEFSAKRKDGVGLLYEITLVLYFNTLSGVAAASDDIEIDFGDGTSQTVRRNLPWTELGNNTTKSVFVVEHKFPGPSTYNVRMVEQNRNAGIKNIPSCAGGDCNVAFYVEMQLKVNPLYGLNASPVMTVPPIDFGNVGKIFTHNPGAYDADGDSLSYELIPSKSGLNTPIPGYNYPGSPVFGGQSTSGGAAFLTLDPVTGDLVWNAPSDYGTKPRYYNIAMQITEWRFGRAIGYVVRDMQVEILEAPNNPPKLTLPNDICIGAGTLLEETITATDPDKNPVNLEYFGQTLTLSSNPSTFVVSGQHGLNPQGAFTWQTNCTHVRRQPYQVIFKATDEFVSQPPVLTDVQSWLIYVKGPKITGITASSGFNFIKLKWPLYTCSSQAEKINIYRIDCDSVSPNTDPCKTGPLAGYTLIGTVGANVTEFDDNDKGKGLNKGKAYSYILVAEYPAPGYGESFPSDQILASLSLDAPVFSSIDVLSTSSTTGQIFLKWYTPKDPSVSAPYIYELERGVGANPASFALVATVPPGDTSYTDSNLDTKNTIYSYRIRLVNNGLYSSTIPVFDVAAKAGNSVVNLSWKLEQPWTVDSIQIHRKINTGALVKIATLNGAVPAYTDNAVQNCDTVYYQVKQFGSYCDKLLREITTAISSMDSVRPMDDTPLPAPALTVRGCNGDTSVYQNVLNWTSLYNATCNTLDHYNVYFSKHEADNINLLLTTEDITYIDKNRFTTAGCYVVSATNLAGVEGAKSAKICVDDCPFYKLPNLLTVNNDGKNDLIMPFPYPRGAEYVRYSVYNRWGALVFFRDTDIHIKWDGSINREMLSDGIYYYSAEVHYYGRLDPDDEVKTLKGWLQILTTK